MRIHFYTLRTSINLAHRHGCTQLNPTYYDTFYQYTISRILTSIVIGLNVLQRDSIG